MVVFELIGRPLAASELFLWAMRLYLSGPHWYRLADGRLLHRSEYFLRLLLACRSGAI